MPLRDSAFRLHGIILRYTAQHSLESFAADEMAVDAVIRNLEVIGEAARHVDEPTMQRLPDVPWREMRDLRNLLAHEYFGVSIPIIWQTVVRDLPPELDLPTWMRERSRSRSAGSTIRENFPANSHKSAFRG